MRYAVIAFFIPFYVAAATVHELIPDINYCARIFHEPSFFIEGRWIQLTPARLKPSLGDALAPYKILLTSPRSHYLRWIGAHFLNKSVEDRFNELKRNSPGYSSNYILFGTFELLNDEWEVVIQSIHKSDLKKSGQ
jgi:hypothetical protein